MEEKYIQGYADMTDDFPVTKVRVFDIDYDVNEEDIEENSLIEGLDVDYKSAAKEIEESLPKDFEIEVMCSVDDEEFEDYVSEEISNQTGWLVNSFNYEIIEE